MSIGKPKGALTGVTLLDAVERYRGKTGEWPNALSGDATDYFGFNTAWTTWAEVDGLLREADDVLTLKSFCHILEVAEGKSEDERRALVSAEIGFVNHCLLAAGLRKRPSAADAVFIRLSELAGGAWAVDIYTPDGWGTLFKADSKNEANEIMQVLIRQHHLKVRSPVLLSETDPTPTT